MAYQDNRKSLIVKVSNQEERLIYDRVDKTYAKGVFYCVEWQRPKYYVLRIPLANIVYVRETFMLEDGGQDE